MSPDSALNPESGTLPISQMYISALIAVSASLKI
jgi:hypothetical protein